MTNHFPLMIPGAVAAACEEVVAPYDGSRIATVDIGDAGAVEQALNNAYSFFADRAMWLPAWRRIEILQKTMDLMRDKADELALEAAREGGKPLTDSEVEVARAIDSVQICIETLRTEGGTEIPMDVNKASAGRMAFTHKMPIGVVVAVSAFNHPLNLIVHQVAPAVATGCPVIVKPAGDTPLSCFRFLSMLREAGLPEEWCQAALIPDNVATQLVTDSRVAFFSFIGSARVGWMLRSKLSAGTRCALEHGGAAPVIVAEDADMSDALPLLAKGGLYHAGQVCVSVQRVFVHESIARAVADGLVEQARAMRVGDPTRKDTDIGPLIRHAEVDRIEDWVGEAAKHGGQLLCGGKKLSDSTYAPTILFDPPSDAKVSTLEIFGPIICIYPYRELDDAIARANALPYSFQAAVFTNSLDVAMRVYSRIDASAVMINDQTAFRVDWMPFAGLGQSGLGIGGIPYTMRDMQVDKMMVLRSQAW